MGGRVTEAMGTKAWVTALHVPRRRRRETVTSPPPNQKAAATAPAGHPPARFKFSKIQPVLKPLSEILAEGRVRSFPCQVRAPSEHSMIPHTGATFCEMRLKAHPILGVLNFIIREVRVALQELITCHETPTPMHGRLSSLGTTPCRPIVDTGEPGDGFPWRATLDFDWDQ
jgi:hypothetical protein